jgi:hypothetical protein
MYTSLCDLYCISALKDIINMHLRFKKVRNMQKLQ